MCDAIVQRGSSVGVIGDVSMGFDVLGDNGQSSVGLMEVVVMNSLVFGAW